MNSFMRRVEVPRCAVVFLFRCLHRCSFVVCIYFLLWFWKNWRKSGPPCISFSTYKITLSGSPQKNKNTELKRLFKMKTRHFSVCFFFGICQSVKDYPVFWKVEQESRYQTVCRNFLPTGLLITVELSVLVITTLH